MKCGLNLPLGLLNPVESHQWEDRKNTKALETWDRHVVWYHSTARVRHASNCGVLFEFKHEYVWMLQAQTTPWEADTTLPLPSRIRVKNWEKYHEMSGIIWNLEYIWIYAVGSPFIWHLSSFRHDLLGPAVLGQGGNGANTWQGSETSPVD